MKYLLLLLAIGLGVLIGIASARRARRPSDDAARNRAPAPTSMVRCVQCGAWIPESEAIQSDSGARCRDH